MSDQPTRRDLAAALVAEFAAAVGSVVADGRVTVEPRPPASGNGWIVPIAASGPSAGEFVAWIDRDGAAAVARLVLGTDQPDDAGVADMLREMWSQAASAACLKEPLEAYKMTVAAPEPADALADADGFALDLAGQGTAAVGIAGAFAAADAIPMADAVAVAPPPSTLTAQPRNLEVVLDIELPLIVRFGRTVMSLKALSGLGPGSIVDMNRSPDDLVEIVVSDQVIARGEVVVVSGNYGVRVIELLSPADRVRALEV